MMYCCCVVYYSKRPSLFDDPDDAVRDTHTDTLTLENKITDKNYNISLYVCMFESHKSHFSFVRSFFPLIYIHIYIATVWYKTTLSLCDDATQRDGHTLTLENNKIKDKNYNISLCVCVFESHKSHFSFLSFVLYIYICKV